MKIPSKLKIGAFNVNIRLVKDLGDDGQLNGEDTILLNADLSQKERELTLWHEVIHAINPGFTEKDVEWLSRALYQILDDNHLLK